MPHQDVVQIVGTVAVEPGGNAVRIYNNPDSVDEYLVVQKQDIQVDVHELTAPELASSGFIGRAAHGIIVKGSAKVVHVIQSHGTARQFSGATSAGGSISPVYPPPPHTFADFNTPYYAIPDPMPSAPPSPPPTGFPSPFNPGGIRIGGGGPRSRNPRIIWILV